MDSNRNVNWVDYHRNLILKSNLKPTWVGFGNPNKLQSEKIQMDLKRNEDLDLMDLTYDLIPSSYFVQRIVMYIYQKMKD